MALKRKDVTIVFIRDYSVHKKDGEFTCSESLANTIIQAGAAVLKGTQHKVEAPKKQDAQQEKPAEHSKETKVKTSKSKKKDEKDS